LEIWIVNRTVLADMINRHQMVDAAYGMREMIGYFVKNGIVKVHAVEFKGYARCFRFSLENYVKYSFELLDRDVAEELFKPDWPIYTATHDTPPALYGEKPRSPIPSSPTAALIEGEVHDSIICRNVKIGKGAKVSVRSSFRTSRSGAL
jgi:glucose-1-phosphate adenylyltransferase